MNKNGESYNSSMKAIAKSVVLKVIINSESGVDKRFGSDKISRTEK